jgi:hypothetical protein
MHHSKAMFTPVLNQPAFIGRKVLVGVPQWSKFGGSKAKFGRSWECDISKLAPSLIKTIFLECFKIKCI